VFFGYKPYYLSKNNHALEATYLITLFHWVILPLARFAGNKPIRLALPFVFQGGY
jgi:hypothetical protein